MTCLHCQAEIPPGRGLYCSDTCKAKRANQKAVERRRLKRLKEREATGRLALQCGECEQMWVPDWTKKGPRVYCTDVCRHAAERRKETIARRRRAGKQGEPRPLDCLTCHGPIQRKAGDPPRKYCGEVCRLAKRSQGFSERREAREAEEQERQLAAARFKSCENCANWGAKGCVENAFRVCNPGVFSRMWQAREVSA